MVTVEVFLSEQKIKDTRDTEENSKFILLVSGVLNLQKLYPNLLDKHGIYFLKMIDFHPVNISIRMKYCLSYY